MNGMVITEERRAERQALRVRTDAPVAACRAYLDAIPDPPAVDSFLRLVTESKRAAANGTISWLETYSRELAGTELSV